MIKVDNIWKNERKDFRKAIKAISPTLKASFDIYDCRIELPEPYIVNDDFLKEKSRVKFAIYDLTTAWRERQFNQYSK